MSRDVMIEGECPSHRRGGEEVVRFATVCEPTGAVMVVPISLRVAERYLELHDLLPGGLHDWPEADLDDLVQEVDGADVDTWERVLIMLAHHRSRRAAGLLLELGFQVPPELKSFAELAFAESLGWLGFDYVRESIEERPVIGRTRRGRAPG